MRDHYEDRLLESLGELGKRAKVLGAQVRRLDAAGDDAIGRALTAVGVPPKGWRGPVEAGGSMVGLFTPGRRKDHAIAIIAPEGGMAGERVLESLRLTASDLVSTGDSETAIDEYCGNLTQSYENMAMIYRLVRSLGRLGSAREVVEQSVENMVETLSCDWAAVRFADDSSVLGELSAGFFYAGKTRDGEDVDRAAARLIEGHLCDSAVVIPPEDNGGIAAVIQPIRLRSELVGRIVIGGKHDETGDVSSFDTQLMEAVAACLGSLLETIKLYDEQAAMFLGTLRAFSSSLDAKDRYTRGHSERVALLGKHLALASGMDEAESERVYLAGTLHDIGKIGVPDAVLGKPGKLTDDEFGMIKRHPRIGYDILKPIPNVRDLLPGVLHHHERWDGFGYPEKLAGEDIPLMARILAVADTFDAMSSNRAYRPARGRDEVLAEIEKCAGAQFDPDLAPAFLSMDLSPFDEMLARHICEQVDSQDAVSGSGDSAAAA